MISPDINFDCDRDNSCCKSYAKHRKDLMFRYLTFSDYRKLSYCMLCPDQIENAVLYGWKSIQPCLAEV